MDHVRVGKEFPEMRENERRVKFIRGGDAVRTGGWLKEEPNPLSRLAFNLYSLKIEKIPTGMLVLDDWLGCYRVDILPNMGSGELVSLDLEAHDNSCYGAWSVPKIFILCPWYMIPHNVRKIHLILLNLFPHL